MNNLKNISPHISEIFTIHVNFDSEKYFVSFIQTIPMSYLYVHSVSFCLGFFFQIGLKPFKLGSYSKCSGPKGLKFVNLCDVAGSLFRVSKNNNSRMSIVPKSTGSFFKLPWYSKLRPSKSLWDQDSFCCVSREFVFSDTSTDPCL